MKDLNKNEKVKRIMMFIKGEDYYFLTYNLIILLHQLNCYDNVVFKDYRKLPFIIEFVANAKLVQILQKDGKMSELDRYLMKDSLHKGNLHQALFLKLLRALDNKILHLEKDEEKQEIINVSLLKSDLVASMIDNTIFSIEIGNAQTICTKISRLSVLKLDSFFDKLYNNDISWRNILAL